MATFSFWLNVKLKVHVTIYEDIYCIKVVRYFLYDFNQTLCLD